MPGCVSILGLGRMGSAAARRLSAAGFRVVLWNRTRERAERVAREVGGDVVSTPAEAAARCGVVHVFVSDDQASYQVLAGEDGVLWAGRGVTVYNHTTVSVAHSLQMLEWLGRRGQVYVEAPVIGGPPAAERGELLVLCSSREPGDCGAESLAALGSVVELGPPPRAVAAKLAFNDALLGFMASLGEALMLAEAYGVEQQVFIERVLSRTWMSVVVERYRERFRPEPGRARFLARLAGKDARYALDALARMGLESHVASAATQYYSLMEGEGLGDADYPSLVGFLAGRGRQRRVGDGADNP